MEKNKKGGNGVGEEEQSEWVWEWRGEETYISWPSSQADQVNCNTMKTKMVDEQGSYLERRW
jgi:hypothetical protein